ncbi:CMF_collapsed_G0002980.mRNA.1.CDS.1 [Saccharomyces cerevisiae]|nr:CMF_collapsed_G0002980.mRNA.1.CDS.1 [Saccharomyces cerevisiae]
MGVCTIFRWLFAAYLLSSYKSLPGAYFVRFYYYVIQNLFLPMFTGFETENIKKLEKNEYGCFSYTSLDTYASPFECDFYFHKSNSTYFAELDISRGNLMCKIFQKLMLNSKHYPYIPVANVFTNFLKETKPFQKYSVSSRIICWDEKWIYVMSRFTIKKGTVLCSLSLTKYVLKDGRKTIKPKDALEYCGLYNEKVAKISEDNLKLLTERCGFHETVPLENLSQEYCSEI